MPAPSSARRTYELSSYGLPFVADLIGHPLLTHHDAKQDCVAAAEVAIDLSRRRQATSVDELVRTIGARIGMLEPGMWSGCRTIDIRALMRPPEAKPDADPRHPMYGQTVVFTGALQTMVRRIAWERVALVDGRPERTPTKRTTVLVEGMQDPTRLRPGFPLSTKAERVLELRALGHPIEIMSEPQFLAVVTDDSMEGFKADVADVVRYQAWMNAGV